MTSAAEEGDEQANAGIQPTVQDEQIVLIAKQAVEQYTDAMEVVSRSERLQKFAQAEQLFRQAMEASQSTGADVSLDLLVNLGNAALQAEHIGSAITAFRRALLKQPDLAQARQNLQYARATLPETFRVDESSQLFESLFFWRALLSTGQVRLWAAAAFLLMSIIVGAALARKSSLLWNLATLPFAMWIVLLVSLWFESSGPSQDAVVISDESFLYSADSENSALRLTQPLPDGTEVETLERRGRWTEISFAGKTGWIRSSTLEYLVE